jgi:hypothetical protein
MRLLCRLENIGVPPTSASGIVAQSRTARTWGPCTLELCLAPPATSGVAHAFNDQRPVGFELSRSLNGFSLRRQNVARLS